MKNITGGTAYITDLGMTAPSESVLGMDRDLVIKLTTQLPVRLEVAKGPIQLQGIILSLDENTKKQLELTNILSFSGLI